MTEPLYDVTDPVYILLVEDSTFDAEIVLRNFDRVRLRNRVHHVKDGAAAMDFLFNRGPYEDSSLYPRPDLVLLDLKLPRVSGREVLEAMRSDAALRDVPVLVMTSTEPDENWVDGVETGPTGRIDKPVEFSGVLRALRRFKQFSVLLLNDSGT